MAVIVRGRRGDGHGAVVRDRAAVAGLSWTSGARVRDAVRDRGHLLLHRGDLHLDLHLRVEAAQPWPHFWTGVPIVFAGLGGGGVGRGGQRVDERAHGFMLNAAAASSTSTRGGDLQRRDALQAVHMIVAGVRRRRVPGSRRCTRSGCCGAGVTATTASGSSCRSPSAAWRSCPDGRGRLGSPAGCTRTSPSSSPPSSLPETSSNVPETTSADRTGRRPGESAASRSRASRRSCRISRAPPP